MKYILGKKIEMTQIFSEEGTAVPVTKIQAGPCTVVQVKDAEKDGYTAIQFGYGEKKAKNIAKPQRKHMKGLSNFRYLREARIKDDKNELKRGDVIDVSSFNIDDKVNATAVSKGKGFQGVVKRHGFHGSLATHGHKDQLRMPGSIGATGPAHVFKGTKMGGQMGNAQVTVTNLRVVKIDSADNILYIQGAIPGARNGLVIVQGEGEMVKVESKKDESGIMNKESGDETKEDKKAEVEIQEPAQADAEAGKTEKLETKEDKVEDKPVEVQEEKTEEKPEEKPKDEASKTEEKKE